MPPVKKQAAPKAVRAVYVADESFVCEVRGVVYNVSKGERVREGHPLLRHGKFTHVEDLPVEYEWETR